jgi:UBX domain-containing protein 1
MTLGGDDTPSRAIPDPHASSQQGLPVITQRLHIWQDGFSIEDGPLYRFDDPANAQTLQMIQKGVAPHHLMNVHRDQPVDVQLHRHEENYKPPPKRYMPFSGAGQRLGSPTPGAISSSSSSSSRLPGSFPTNAAPAASAASASASTQPPSVDIDSSQPMISLRIQLGNGTRVPVRFNTTHTIGDVYNFINQANPSNEQRPWVLATTFPNKDWEDMSVILGETAEFKRGGTAVQKWV